MGGKLRPSLPRVATGACRASGATIGDALGVERSRVGIAGVRAPHAHGGSAAATAAMAALPTGATGPARAAATSV